MGQKFWICKLVRAQEPLGSADMMELHWKHDIYMDMHLFIHMQMLIHVNVRDNVHAHVSVKERQWPRKKCACHYDVHV